MLCYQRVPLGNWGNWIAFLLAPASFPKLKVVLWLLPLYSQPKLMCEIRSVKHRYTASAIRIIVYKTIDLPWGGGEVAKVFCFANWNSCQPGKLWAQRNNSGRAVLPSSGRLPRKMCPVLQNPVFPLKKVGYEWKRPVKGFVRWLAELLKP